MGKKKKSRRRRRKNVPSLRQVEEILGDYEGKLFLVKWKGWRIKGSTWEFEKNLIGCGDALREYQKCKADYPNVDFDDFTKSLEIKAIVGEKIVYNPKEKRRDRYFICRWKGFPRYLETVEPELDVDVEVLRKYKREKRRLKYFDDELIVEDSEEENEYDEIIYKHK